MLSIWRRTTCCSCAAMLRPTTRFSLNGPLAFQTQGPPQVRGASSDATETEPSDSSLLLVSGRRASQVYRTFAPEFDSGQLKKREKILQLLLQEKGSKIDLSSVIAGIEEYEELKLSLKQISKDFETTMESIKEGKKAGLSSSNSELQRLEKTRKSMQSQLKDVRGRIWDLEEGVLLQALKLPNVDCEVEEESSSEVEIVSKGHVTLRSSSNSPLRSALQLINECGLGEVTPDGGVYFVGHLAVLEQALVSKVLSHFYHDDRLEYSLISCPDFSKSVMVEASGSACPSNPRQSLALRSTQGSEKGKESGTNNKVHLVGGASLESLLAYLARSVIQNPEACLPLNLLTLGRHYEPAGSISVKPSSSSHEAEAARPVQSTCAHALCVAKSRQQLYKEVFPAFLSTVTSLYDDLVEKGLLSGYRILKQTGSSAPDNMTMRYSFQIPALENAQNESSETGTPVWRELGHVGVHNDYYSSRIMLKQSQMSVDKTSAMFDSVWMVSGQIINVNQVLMGVLEHNQAGEAGKSGHNLKVLVNKLNLM